MLLSAFCAIVDSQLTISLPLFQFNVGVFRLKMPVKWNVEAFCY